MAECFCFFKLLQNEIETVVKAESQMKSPVQIATRYSQMTVQQ